MFRENAPAKINLYLHVGPLRDDGLHDLASLFVFTERGDVVSATAADDISLKIEGPFADALTAFPVEENLVYRAALALHEFTGITKGAALTLEKNLPIAAGIGGGSADAAAALRALCNLWAVNIHESDLHNIAFQLGADIPACLAAHPVLVDGAGERLSDGPTLPDLYVCLVNPGVDMPTGPVFRRYDADYPSPPTPTHPTDLASMVSNISVFMNATRNDLEAPAIAISGEVGALLTSLANAHGVLAARMSGSGATCFGLFANEADAVIAARRYTDQGKWAMASKLVSG